MAPAIEIKVVTSDGRTAFINVTPDTIYMEIKRLACLEFCLDLADVRMSIGPGLNITNARLGLRMRKWSAGDYVMLELRHLDIPHKICAISLIIRMGLYEACDEQLHWCRDCLPIVFAAGNYDTPWITAVKEYRIEFFALLAKWYLVGINIANRDGETPLSVAVYNRRLDAIGELIKLGANVNENCGRLLWYAVGIDNVELVQMLIEAGASISSIISPKYGCIEDRLQDEDKLCGPYLQDCFVRRRIMFELVRDKTSYLGLLPNDLVMHYLHYYLYNALGVKYYY